jgi:hypothetical protein
MDLEDRNRRAKKRAQDSFETTIGGWKPREGSLYWYPLNMIQEITVYPLLFGQARLVRGRRDKDHWEVGYDYPDVPTAMKAAGQWDGKGDPGFGWLKKHEEGTNGEPDDLNES